MLLVVAPLGVLLIALFGLGLGIKFRRALMLTSAVTSFGSYLISKDMLSVIIEPELSLLLEFRLICEKAIIFIETSHDVYFSSF